MLPFSSVLQIRDVYPGSRIPDPKTATKERGENEICCPSYFVATNISKIENYFNFEMVKKKNMGQFTKNYRTFYPVICHEALKNMGLGSGVLFWILDPGVKKVTDPDPQHCFFCFHLILQICGGRGEEV
jgi:hypothetical protein